MLGDKLKIIEFNINGIIELNKQNDITLNNTKQNFKELKNHFSANYNEIVNDLALIINNLSENDKNDKNEEHEEHDESPASKINSLNLNWKQVYGATDGNEVKNIPYGGSYWRVKSEEVLDGPFICRILVEKINCNDTWHHGAGIIKYDQDIMEAYYNQSCLYLSSGHFTKPFYGGCQDEIHQKWENGNEIIIKRDYENDLWFGLNDEFSMIKSCKAEGQFRIVLGFLNISNKDDAFKLIQLKVLSK